MKLKEYQGKELFAKYGIPIPVGKIITSIEGNENPDMIAKAQILSGKRGKKGLIKPGTKENLEHIFKHCKEVLLEEMLNIEKEYYLALTLDRELKDVVILFSEAGGMDVEEAKTMKKIPYDKMDQFPRKEFLPTIGKMHELMKGMSATLVEINPLVLVKGRLIAADSKVILDDNVEHPEYKDEEVSELEKEAKGYGLNYVELEGDIAIIGNGAGLVMATLDMIHHFGGSVSSFLDLGGGASINRMSKAMDIVMRKSPKVILINMFGGITKCDEISQGLVDFKKANTLDIPIVIRMIGTNEEQAKKILLEEGIDTFDSMEECAKQAVENVNSDK